jgi:hypothetical protein
METDLKRLLQTATNYGNEQGYITHDEVSNLCNGDVELTEWVVNHLKRLKKNNAIQFELDLV